MLQALSPEETSRWCASLAPCGIRGELLSSLQAAIVRQRVDAKRLDEMLKANTLHDLCVDGLNPRLGAAVRRAWNKDFEHTRFIPHVESQPQRGSSRPGSNPPPYEQRVRSAEKRAEAQREVVSAESFAAANLARRVKDSLVSDFCDKGFESHVAAKAAAPVSYAPPQMLAKPVDSHAPIDDNCGGLGDVFAPKPPAPTSFAAPEMVSKPPGAGRQQPGDSSAGDLSDIFAAKPPAPKSFAAPEMIVKPPRSGRQRPCDEGGGGDLADVFAAKSPAPKSFAAPEMLTKPPRSGGRRRPGDDRAGDLGDIFAPKPPAPKSFAAPEMLAKPARSEQQFPSDGVAEGGLADVFTPQAPAPNSYAPQGMAAQGRRGGRRQHQDNGWEGVSLGDALTSAKPEGNRYGAPQQDSEPPASSAPSGRRRAPANDGWEGVGLGDALGPKQAARHNYAQAESQVESCSYPQQQGSSRPSKPTSDWQDMSLGDAMQRDPRHDARHASPTSQCAAPPPSVAAPAQNDDPWAGVALGGAPSRRDAAACDAPRAASGAAPIDWSKEPRRGGKRGAEPATSASNDKSPSEILEWLKTLPESHVPEKAKADLAEQIESQSMDGNAFTAYVQTVPPEICAPKHAMKLKAAWKNVLAEAACREVAKQNFEAAANSDRKGGVEVKC